MSFLLPTEPTYAFICKFSYFTASLVKMLMNVAFYVYQEANSIYCQFFKIFFKTFSTCLACGALQRLLQNLNKKQTNKKKAHSYSTQET